jgi:hypothetical protein
VHVFCAHPASLPRCDQALRPESVSHLFMATQAPPLDAAAAAGERLRDRSTRLATLGALEAHAVPIPTAVALEAAAVLCELQALDAAEAPKEVHDRAGLLVARLVAEALPYGAAAQAAVIGAAHGGGRYARCFNAEGSVIAATARTPAAELTRADARSYACLLAQEGPAFARGMTAPIKAAGFTTMEFLELVSSGSLRARLSAVCLVYTFASDTD